MLHLDRTELTSLIRLPDFSNSNIHRVVPPPPPQDVHTRWSMVYFIRPSFDASLYPLVDLSPKIAEAASKHPTIGKMEKGITAGQWFKRRIANQRVANRKGPETWAQSRGTERKTFVALFGAAADADASFRRYSNGGLSGPLYTNIHSKLSLKYHLPSPRARREQGFTRMCASQNRV